MANGIVGNVFIVDSAQGNTALNWPSIAKVKSVSFYATNTVTGIVQFSASDTSQVVIVLNGSNPSFHLGGVFFTEMKVPVLTAGTAYFYFG